jgi:hypothetical protein
MIPRWETSGETIVLRPMGSCYEKVYMHPHWYPLHDDGQPDDGFRPSFPTYCRTVPLFSLKTVIGIRVK